MAEQLVAVEALKAASGAVQSAQEVAKGRTSCAPPPLPPPASPPPASAPGDEGADGDDAPHSPTGVADIEKPKSKNITLFKQFAKVALCGEVRRFEMKLYGPMFENLPLRAAEFFEQEALSMLDTFDGCSKKRDQRIDILQSADCDPKFLAKGKTIAMQRDALVRQLCKGKVEKVEQQIMSRLIKFVAAGKDTSQWCIKPTLSRFRASFTSSKQSMEKNFTRFTEAIHWLKSLNVADKEWVL